MPRINAVSFHQNPSGEAICRTVRALGYDGLEVSRPPFYDDLQNDLARHRFVEWTREIGLSLYGFDCWVDVDPYTRAKETLDGFGRAVDWAADLKLGMLISHDPWSNVNEERSPRQCLEASVALFRRVADMCASAGLTLVFEPHPDTLSMQNDWAVDFVTGVGKGHAPGAVGLLYDCCHYGVGQPNGHVDSIKALGPWIRHLHFSDGDKQTYARHLPLGEGTLDIEAIVKALKGINYRGTLTADMYTAPDLDEGARRNVERIRAVEQRLGLVSP